MGHFLPNTAGAHGGFTASPYRVPCCIIIYVYFSFGEECAAGEGAQCGQGKAEVKRPTVFVDFIFDVLCPYLASSTPCKSFDKR